MKLTSSYGVEIKKVDFDIMDTVRIYREALSFCIDVFDKEWAVINAISGNKEKVNYAEHLIHSTDKNTAKYNFDSKFYKFPSYLRRAVIQDALGCVSSYRSNLDNWNKDPQGKKPTLTMDRNATPTFYHKNMYLTSDNLYECQIKVYLNKDWVWRTIKLLKTDVDYVQKHLKDAVQSAPTLEKRFGKYFLRFAFTERVGLNTKDITKQKICAVDLGLNTDAVCTIMTSDGTVHDRKFINFPCEKDQLERVLNRIKKRQRKYRNQSVKLIWAYAQRLNNELSVKIAAAIVEYAKSQGCDVIVFEYLDMKKKKRGSKKQLLSLWRKNGIQEIAGFKAHKNSIRMSRICAWNTSKLAFDGSGKIERDKDNHANATFQSGKRYNADLNASYNIGSRYFIRELLKPFGETQKSQFLAKAPELVRRTTCTYSTLLKLNSALAELNKAA
jgi:transposase